MFPFDDIMQHTANVRHYIVDLITKFVSMEERFLVHAIINEYDFQMLFMKNKGDLGTGFILRRDRPRASSLHPVFGCMDSVSKGGTQLYRPCSANGVVDLEEGDFLYIQASFRKRILEKTGHHAGTHFGAIYLGPAGKKHKWTRLRHSLNSLRPREAYIIYASVNYVIIGSDNGLSLVQHQSII